MLYMAVLCAYVLETLLRFQHEQHGQEFLLFLLLIEGEGLKNYCTVHYSGFLVYTTILLWLLGFEILSIDVVFNYSCLDIDKFVLWFLTISFLVFIVMFYLPTMLPWFGIREPHFYQQYMNTSMLINVPVFTHFVMCVTEISILLSLSWILWIIHCYHGLASAFLLEEMKRVLFHLFVLWMFHIQHVLEYGCYDYVLRLSILIVYSFLFCCSCFTTIRLTITLSLPAGFGGHGPSAWLGIWSCRSGN